MPDVGIENVSSLTKEIEMSQTAPHPISRRVYARVGLMGNPSDGFNGKTVSLSIKNFWADVTIHKSSTLRLLPHPRNDHSEFNCLKNLHAAIEKEGYFGGLRLLQATCKTFYQHCIKSEIVLPQINFTLSYDTNIPRQVGLAGSSAIVTGALKCLMAFYQIDIPKEAQPSLILSVEVDEFNIQAGLQDRVVQVYEGLVYMNFDKEQMNKHGHGVYKYISTASLPEMFLVYENDPTDSGKIHSNVSHRYNMGDPDVIKGMTQLAMLAESAYHAIINNQWTELRDLADKNFECRRQMYTDVVLGKRNLQMVAIGKKFGAAVKFPGSGGAILGFPRADTDVEGMADLYRSEGFAFAKVVPIGHQS